MKCFTKAEVIVVRCELRPKIVENCECTLQILDFLLVLTNAAISTPEIAQAYTFALPVANLPADSKRQLCVLD